VLAAMQIARAVEAHPAKVTVYVPVYAMSGGTLIALAAVIRAILLASAMAATFVARRASNAVSQGRCLVPWILA
jgi:membrane-bound ClpP family serine protease